MSAFGEVANHEPAEAIAAPGEAHELVDINDPRLTSEVVTVNPDADAYAVLPPLPDGKWRAKAKQLDIKDDKGQLQRFAVFSRAKMANGKPFMATNVEFSIIDHSGAFDGVKLTEYWVKTLLDERKGTSQAVTLTRKLGGKAISGTQAEQMQALLAELAKEPELIVETAWKAECQACQQKAKDAKERQPSPILQGMHRFASTRTPGVHDPMTQCGVCKAQVRAQARIVGLFALTETQATRGTGNPAATK